MDLHYFRAKPVFVNFDANAWRIFRYVAVLGSVESLMPLHSAIASARLKSSLAVDSVCWSWLSQGK